MFVNRNIIDLASKFKLFSHNRPDDLADELNFKYSSLILILFCIVITYSQYFLEPISCYMATSPNKRSIIRYLESYCWVTGTIPITYNGDIPSDAEFQILEKEKILYYQWVPFILALQALMCYLPQMIWRMLYTNNSDTDMIQLFTKATKASNLNSDARSHEVQQLSKILETLLFQSREFIVEKHNKVRGLFEKITSLLTSCKRLGAHFIVYYFFIKVLYLVNSIGQIFLMQSYLKLKNYNVFGVELLNNIRNGRNWDSTLVFPREAYCFCKVRQLGTVNYIVAQCALPLNMLNEKFYIFYFFWMVLVTTATVISIIIWITRTVIRHYQTSFVKKYLILNNDYNFGDKCNKRIRNFEIHFLQRNGLFILQMLESNCGEIITAEVVSQLWSTYKSKYENRIQCDVDGKCKLTSPSMTEMKCESSEDTEQDFRGLEKLSCIDESE